MVLPSYSIFHCRDIACAFVWVPNTCYKPNAKNTYLLYCIIIAYMIHLLVHNTSMAPITLHFLCQKIHRMNKVLKTQPVLTASKMCTVLVLYEIKHLK